MISIPNIIKILLVMLIVKPKNNPFGILVPSMPLFDFEPEHPGQIWARISPLGGHLRGQVDHITGSHRVDGLL